MTAHTTNSFKDDPDKFPDDVLPTRDPKTLVRCLIAAGYAGGYVGKDLDGTVHLHAPNDADVRKDDMRAAVIAAYPPPGDLSHDVLGTLLIAGDGLATGQVTVTDPRGPGAQGKTIRLRAPRGSSIPVDKDRVVLNALGEGAFTFGPYSGSLGPVPLELHDEFNAVGLVVLPLRFGS